MHIRTLILKIELTNEVCVCSLQQYNNNLQIYIKNAPKQLLSANNIFMCLKIGNSKPFVALPTIEANCLHFSVQTICDIYGNINIVLATREYDYCKIIASGYLGTNCNNLINTLKTDAMLTQSITSLFDDKKSEQVVIKENITTSEQCEPEIINEKNKNISNQEQELTFFEQIAPNINALFAGNEQDQVLMQKIPNSIFAKITQSEDNFFHCVGVIYSDESLTSPEYICYALPCKNGDYPPPNMQKFAQYLPTSEQGGYFLMYQKAIDGENVIINS